MLKVPDFSIQDLGTSKYHEIHESDLSESLSCARVVGMPRTVVENVDGHLVSKVVFEETPLSERDKGLKCSDFALENLLESGYQLHRVDVNSPDRLRDADAASAGVSALQSAGVKVNVQPQQNSLENE